MIPDLQTKKMEAAVPNSSFLDCRHSLSRIYRFFHLGFSNLLRTHHVLTMFFNLLVLFAAFYQYPIKMMMMMMMIIQLYS